jgi:hypothetical protein
MKKTGINRWMDTQIKKTKKSVNRNISRQDLITLTALTFIVAFLQVSSMLMNMYNWASNPGVDFGSYHLYAPLVALFGWTGYLLVLIWERVHLVSILPYVPAMIGLFYNFVLSLIRFDIIGPELLKFF